MNAATYAAMARRKDPKPWVFSEDNPGYKWLIARQESFIEEDSARDPALVSSSVSAGSVSSSKSYRTTPVSARVDILEAAIAIYKRGVSSLPTRTIGRFGTYEP